MTRKESRKEYYQDGGQFYDANTNKLLADYGDTYSFAVAVENRKRFLADHPEYNHPDADCGAV